MKKLCLLILLLAVPLYAAMSDTTAIAKAKLLWGNLGRIGAFKDTVSTTQMKQVGVNSTGCATAFTLLGEGVSTWDAAFADYDAKVLSGAIKIGGPFKGVIPLSVEADGWASGIVSRVQFYVDGVAVTPQYTTPGITVTATVIFNTATIPNGFHVLCAKAYDAAGIVGTSDAWFIRTDQTILSGATGAGPFANTPGLRLIP